MFEYKKLKLLAIFFPLFIFTILNAEEEEIYLKAISDQIQVITKDLKTLEKAVYQKSDALSSSNLSQIKSDGLNEDILTKHLLKLNDIENQFRELTNRFEEINFKMDKLSKRVTKIQSDTQMRISDLEEENSLQNTKTKKKVKKRESKKKWECSFLIVKIYIYKKKEPPYARKK